MDMTPEQAYTDLLRQLASPLGVEPEALADAFRGVEQMHAAGQIADWQLQNAREAYARTTSRLGDAAHWVADKAKDTLHAAGEQVRKRASAAAVTYANKDPVRAMLVAAATGAVLMSLVSMAARSGVRTVRRKIRR